jgi:UDP-N-acetylglucosamine:LPS N-acetylglucosamine transferase
MGAGHDGAARELATQMRAAGHHATVRDFLDTAPLHLGSALRRGYEFELKHIPSVYDMTYRLWYRVPWLCGPVGWLITLLTRRRLLRWVRHDRADVVVSTYPLATGTLGRLRAAGRLKVAVVNFITDFGVHPMWVHHGIDINLAVHRHPATAAGRRSGRPSVACGPVVSDAFKPAPDAVAERDAARRHLGLQPDERAVLVVAGSWGVGGVTGTFRSIAGDGRFVPIVVCGRDDRLLRAMQDEADRAPGRSVVLGWTDRMPELMVAADALVENAGGLTSLEALRRGLPVVSYQPIAGHGKANTAAMADAGISRLATGEAELVAALDALSEPGGARDAQVASGHAMFTADAADHVVSAAYGDHALAPAVWRRPVRVAARIAATAAALLGLTWTGLTAGVGVAAAEGAGVAHPPPGAGSVAYLGVRLDSAELADPGIVTRLIDLDATAVLDARTAEADPAAVKHLGAEGVDVESGGHGQTLGPQGTSTPTALWTRARRDAGAAGVIGVLAGQSVTVFVPGRRLNAWDLVDCHHVRTSVVVPDTTFVAADFQGPASVGAMAARQIYLVDGLDASPARLAAVLDTVATQLSAAGLPAVPLDTLR